MPAAWRPKDGARCTRFGLTLVALAAPVMAQSEIVIPTSRQAAGANRELTVRDVRGLIVHLGRIGAVPPGEEEEPLPEEGGTPEEWLATAVRTFVSPPIRDTRSVRMVSGRYLVSVGTAEQQGWIDRFLKFQAEAPENRILVASTLYELDVRAFKELGIETGIRSYDAEEGEVVVRRLDQSGAEKKLAPRLVSLPWHPAEIFVGEQIEYVRDFELGVDDAGGLFADEVWEFLLDGARFSVWPLHLDGGEIGLLGKVEITEVSQPLPKKQLEARVGDRKLEIETPTFTRTERVIGVAVPNGGYAVVPCPPIEGRIPLVVIQLQSG